MNLEKKLERIAELLEQSGGRAVLTFVLPDDVRTISLNLSDVEVIDALSASLLAIVAQASYDTEPPKPTKIQGLVNIINQAVKGGDHA